MRIKLENRNIDIDITRKERFTKIESVEQQLGKKKRFNVVSEKGKHIPEEAVVDLIRLAINS